MSTKTHVRIAVRLMPIVLLGAALLIPTLLRAQHNPDTDRLPSWQAGTAKTAILDFVRQVTDKSGPRYVKPEDRIATFDDDGTLWPEWPRHTNQIQMVFARQRVKQMAKGHPDWEYQQPFKAILDGDDKELARAMTDLWNRIDLLRAANGGMTVDEFGATVRNFLATAKHPRFKVPFTQVAYQPMLELLDLLRANEFKIYLVTSSGADFIRELSERVFEIPRECVIGSTPEYEYRESTEGGFLVRKSNVDIFNDKAAKAENIQLHIGRRPVFVAGNSDGDLGMMGLASGGNKPFLNLLIRHDDSEREFSYEDDSARVAETVRARGWIAVSMKNDFKVIFSFAEE
jgi:hypothetical protein